MVLVSPDIVATGSGSFIKLRMVPMLGSSPEVMGEALQPIADQLGADVKVPYSMAGLEGVGIDYVDKDTELTLHFILVPYGDRGDVLYMQSTADPGMDETVIEILSSMVLDIPTPDVAAIDAAWQTSLAEKGVLTYGDADASVKVVEYLSFTCGHCVRYSRSMDRLIALDVETGRVQFTLALLAGDDYATTATHATYCAAEQGKGYTTHDALFQGYVDRSYDGAYTREGINDLLSGVGLDMDALNTCIDEMRYADQIMQNGIAFTDLGLTGTPTIVFGMGGEAPAPVVFPDGQVWSGAVPLHWVRDVINAYLEDGTMPNDFVTQ